MRVSTLLLTAAALLAPATASALAQSKHRSLSYEACRAAGLNMDFCDEVAVAAYNVDRYEWDDLAAHAQPEAGQSHCDAAASVSGRVRDLGGELRGLLTAPDATGTRSSIEDIAKSLGRVLHTLQDNCAHSGMPNDQHAWFSLSDACLDTESSPDIQPAAVECAKQQSTLAFDAFVTAFGDAGLKTGSFEMYKEDNEAQLPQYWPPRGGVCDFLKSADSWDGQDRRWDNDRVVPALRDQFFSSLVVDPGAPAGDVCASGDISLSAAAPLDVTQKIEWCSKIKLYCAGKADGSEALPPWETGGSTPAPAGGAGDASGCALGLREARGGQAASWLGALALALGLGAWRRRR